MGRINKIWNVEKWKILQEGKNVFNHNDVVYKMEIGESDDYGVSPITEFISKDNYDKIKKKLFYIKTFPYSEIPVLIFDKNYNNIPLVNYRNSKFLDELSFEQNDSNKVMVGSGEHSCCVDLKEEDLDYEFDKILLDKPRALVKKITKKIGAKK